jgi:hypothetical protein
MKKEEILANCIEEIRNGKSTIEDCISRYPEIGEELRSSLLMAAAIKPDEVMPSLEFIQRARRQLFIEMQPALEKKSRRTSRWYLLAPVKWIAGVLIGLVAFSAAGGGTVYASQSSLPGDVLYPVKTAAEKLQLAVTWGSDAKANLHLTLAQRRIDEVTQQVQQNRDINVQALGTVEQQLNDAIKELSNSRDTAANDKILSKFSTATLNQQITLEQVLVNAPDSSKPALNIALTVTRRGNLVASVAFANHDFLEDKPSVSDEELDAGQFKIDGTLTSIQGNTWDVGGVVLKNIHSSKETPPIGSRVIIEGLVKNNEVFITRIEVGENTTAPTKVEGRYGGTNENGTSKIGGIPVQVSDNTSGQLKPGDNVQLEGDHGQSGLDVTHNEKNSGEDKNTTKLNGVLKAIDIKNETIIVESAGSQYTVNISKAQIESDSHKTLKISDLNQLAGQTIKLEGLYKKNGLLFAQQVQVETVGQGRAPTDHNNEKGQGKTNSNHGG